MLASSCCRDEQDPSENGLDVVLNAFGRDRVDHPGACERGRYGADGEPANQSPVHGALADVHAAADRLEDDGRDDI